MSYLEHLRSKLRYNEIMGNILDALSKLGIKIILFYVFLEKETADPPDFESEFEEYEVKGLFQTDMTQIAAIPERKVTFDELSKRISEGKRCLGMKHQGRLIAFTWCDLNECHYEGYRFPLRPNEAYLFDSYTSIPYRGRGILPYLRRRMYAELKQLGKNTFYSVSNRYYISAVRFKLKLNAKIVDSGIYIELFKRWRFTSKARRSTKKTIT